MSLRPPDPYRLLRHLYGTEPFVEFCSTRSIRFHQRPGRRMTPQDYARWRKAVATLGVALRARVDLDLSQVSEVSRPNSLAILERAASGRGRAPDSIPGGAPLALWYLLHQADLFLDTYLGLDAELGSVWRIARAPNNLFPKKLANVRGSLAMTLREYFRARDGTGRFCNLEEYRVGSAYCFIARLSGRQQFRNGFTESGRYSVRPSRPTFPIVFVYEPATGRVLLRARWRAADLVLDLLRIFGRAVLGVSLGPGCLAPVFRLNRLKRPFDPPPDAADMESVRVKAVHLIYPERSGRRRVKLETLSGDNPSAVRLLLRRHGGESAVLSELDVHYAELEIRLRVSGWSRQYVVCLWADRCNLEQTALGDRIRACLVRWGLTHEG